MAKYDEVEIIKRAFDELKALDYEGQMRAINWLRERLQSDYEKAIAERAAERLARIAGRSSQRTGADQ